MAEWRGTDKYDFDAARLREGGGLMRQGDEEISFLVVEGVDLRV